MHEGHLAKRLNHLMSACCDGSDGYEAAAQGVTDLRLKQLLRQLATERRTFAEELRQEVLRLGGEPRLCGTLRGALHRGWMQVAEARGASTADILRQCAFGDQISLRRYEDAVRSDLPEDLNALVTRHFLRLNEVRDLIADLERIHA